MGNKSEVRGVGNLGMGRIWDGKIYAEGSSGKKEKGSARRGRRVPSRPGERMDVDQI